jgi:hypothetical protein
MESEIIKMNLNKLINKPIKELTVPELQNLITEAVKEAMHDLTGNVEPPNDNNTLRCIVKESGTLYSAKDQFFQNIYSTVKIKAKVKNHKLQLKLPDSFQDEDVEVSISPIHQVKKTNTWKEDFKNISVWDIKEDDMRMSSWDIQQY